MGGVWRRLAEVDIGRDVVVATSEISKNKLVYSHYTLSSPQRKSTLAFRNIYGTNYFPAKLASSISVKHHR